MTPAISILMPFRDAAATVARAVGDLRAQTLANWELVAVDDGSTDGSAGVVLAAAEGDRRVRVLGNTGAPGIVGALQTAVDAARAEWLARMDADDRCRRDRLERQWERTADGDVILSNVELLDGGAGGMARYVEWANSLADHEAICHGRFIENPVIHPTVMMRRQAYEAVGGYRDVEWAEDHDLWLRMLQAGRRFVKIGEPLVAWRDSPGRLTRTDPRYDTKARQRLRAWHLSRLAEVGERGVAIAGAGPIGKSLARVLVAEGVEVKGFFEVHPRRIGERIHGVEVAGIESLGRKWREAVLLSSVGLPGVREEIRGLAVEAGYREGSDFWCVC